MTALRVVTDPLMEQRMNALDDGNEIRMSNAAFRAKLKKMTTPDGAFHVADTLEAGGSTVEAMPVGRLFCTIRQIGDVKVSEWCCRADVRSLDRKVRDLTPRQRAVLVRTLRAYGDRRLRELNRRV